MQADAPPSRALPLEQSLPPMRSFAATALPAPARSNSEIAQDFLDLSFRMESGRPIPEMTRFEGPISVRVTGDIPATLVALGFCKPAGRRFSQCSIISAHNWQAQLTPPSMNPKLRLG